MDALPNDICELILIDLIIHAPACVCAFRGVCKQWLAIVDHCRRIDEVSTMYKPKCSLTSDDWLLISSEGMSEKFMQENAEKLDWPTIAVFQRLGEVFMRSMINSFDVWTWHNISIFQKLSESFIRDFADHVRWRKVSANQKLSDEFIREFADRVYWPSIFAHQNISVEFSREFAHLYIMIEPKK